MVAFTCAASSVGSMVINSSKVLLEDDDNVLLDEVDKLVELLEESILLDVLDELESTELELEASSGSSVSNSLRRIAISEPLP